MRHFLWALLPLFGCHWVFGVDGQDSPSDAPEPRVTFSVEVAEVNSRLRVSPGMLDLANSYVRLYDTTPTSRVPLVETAAGEYAAAVPDGASFDIVWQVVDDVVRVQRTQDRAQSWTYQLMGRLDEVAPGADDRLDMSITLATQWDKESSAQLHVAGAWSYLPLASPVFGALRLDRPGGLWSDVISLSARPDARPDSERGDRVSFLRYRQNAYASFLYESLLLPTLDYRAGGTTVIAGTATLVGLAHQMATVLQDDRSAERLATTRPAMPPPAATWGIYSVPAFPPSLVSIRLASGSQTVTLPYTLNLSYGDPFGGRRLMLFNQYTSRSASLPILGTVSLQAGLYAWVDAAEAAAQIKTDASLPLTVTLAGAELANDAFVLSANPASELPISFTVDGNADNYQATLYEIEPAPAGSTIIFRAVLSSTVDANFVLPAGTLAPGRTYFIRAVTYRGYETTASDRRVPRLPFRVGYLDSGTFSIP